MYTKQIVLKIEVYKKKDVLRTMECTSLLWQDNGDRSIELKEKKQ